MVLKVKKTAVLVLMPGLVDRSWSRTVPTLVFRHYKPEYSASPVPSFPTKRAPSASRRR